jgi:Arc/MetJ family transcription regulator
MKHTQTFAQRHPFYMTAETTKRTIELGRALRAQIQRRRNSVTITVDASAVDAALRGTLHSSARRSA